MTSKARVGIMLSALLVATFVVTLFENFGIKQGYSAMTVLLCIYCLSHGNLLKVARHEKGWFRKSQDAHPSR